jgi:phage terminase small subunit
MSRPKKPTCQLKLAGAFKHDPKRARPDEPTPVAGIGPVPRHLDEEHRDIWREMVKMSAPGVLTRQDRIALEIVVIGLYQLRHGVEIYDKDQQKTITVRAPSIDRDRVFKQLGKFGFTPSERSNVVVPKKL